MKSKSDHRIFSYPKHHFICAEDNPVNLIGLRYPQEIYKKLFRNVKHLFIWIHNLESQKMVEFKSNEEMIGKLKDVKIHDFDSAEDGYNFMVNQKDFVQKFYVICSKSARNLFPRIKFQHEFLVCVEQKDIIVQKNIFYLYKDDLLINIGIGLADYYQNFIRKSQNYNKLPNFTPIKDNAWALNVNIMSIFAMLNHQLNASGRQSLIDQLAKLFEYIKSLDHYFDKYDQVINNFISQLRKGELSTHRAIHWYTVQSPVYKLTNNILRATEHPFEIFYIQPFFRDLFRAIIDLGMNQKWKFQQKVVVCFRGGMLSVDELQYFQRNVGEFVCNLGFLSTSTSKQVAIQYTKNVLFQIKINLIHKQLKMELGFAFIDSQSFYLAEQQILFNPLNTFKIVQITSTQIEDQNVALIKLEFGQFQKLFVKNQLSQQYRIHKDFYAYQGRIYRQFFTQGCSLVQNSQNLQGAEQFWLKFVAKSQKNRKFSMYGYYYLMKYYCNIQQDKKALKCIQKLQQQIQQNPQNQSIATNEQKYDIFCIKAVLKSRTGDNKDILFLYQKYKQNAIEFSQNKNFLDILNSVACSFIQSGLPVNALQIYNQLKEVSAQKYGIHHPKYSNILVSIANLYEIQGLYDKALQILTQSGSMISQMKGEISDSYFWILCNISSIFNKMGSILQSNQVAQKCYQLIQKSQIFTYAKYEILGILALNYLAKGQNELAINICQNTVKQIKYFHEQDSVFYLRTLQNLALIYQQLADFEQAYFIYTDILRILHLHNNKNEKYHLRIKMKLGHLYFKREQYHAALMILNQCQSFYQNNGRKDQYQHAFLLNVLGCVQFALGNYSKSSDYFQGVVSIARQYPKMAQIQQFGQNNLILLQINQCKYEQAWLHIQNQRQKLSNFPSHTSIYRKNNASLLIKQLKYQYQTKGSVLSYPTLTNSLSFINIVSHCDKYVELQYFINMLILALKQCARQDVLYFYYLKVCGGDGVDCYERTMKENEGIQQGRYGAIISFKNSKLREFFPDRYVEFMMNFNQVLGKVKYEFITRKVKKYREKKRLENLMYIDF